jgi:uncharacterized protein YggL (DUF469 family)
MTDPIDQFLDKVIIGLDEVGAISEGMIITDEEQLSSVVIGCMREHREVIEAWLEQEGHVSNAS